MTNTLAFLQQAIDHYPRLAAFGFTLVLPHHETMADSVVTFVKH
ncbi:hypothetical protein ACGI40_21895 [Escherichia coli]|nr:hypothetical protein [Escherichia coli]